MSVNIVEGLAAAFQALTGLETISLGTKMMINNSGVWASVGTDAVWEIVKGSGAKIVGATAYPVNNGVLGSFSGLEYEALFDVGGAQLKNCLAAPTQLSNGMRAALQNGGAQIGNTALKPVTDLVVQSTGSGQQVAVTTKGVLAKVGFDAALVSAAAALGVTVGVGIVETNPELVTKIYNRVFNDNIDPQYIADIVENTTVWENIRDGATFLAEDFINAVKGVFIESGVYEGSSEIPGITINTVTGSSKAVFRAKYSNGYAVGVQEITNGTLTSTSDVILVVTNHPTLKGSAVVRLCSKTSFSLTGKRGMYTSTANIEPPTYPELEKTDVNLTSAMTIPSPRTIHSLVISTNPNESYQGTKENGSLSVSCGLPVSAYLYNNSYTEGGNAGAYMAANYFYDDDRQYDVIPSVPTDFDGVSKKEGARYPTPGNTLAEDYPEWDANSVETISDWNDDTGVPNKRKWYPVNTNSDQSTGQDAAQDGSVNESDISDAVNDIDQALEENSDIAPDVETQPDIYPNPNPAPGTDLYPVTPNPPDIDASDGEDPDPTIPILTTVATSGLAHIYNPTLGEVQSLGAALWTPSLIENIKKIFVNPMDGIIGFHILYATPKTGASEEIVLGYYGTGVNAKVVTNQYVEVDCGYVAIDEWWNDARDYEPYVNVSLYLPFIGIVPLKANDVIGSHVKVKYHVDVLTGTCLAMVEVQKYNARGTLYQFVGNCAITIPLSSGNYTAVITSLLSVASSAVGGAAIGGVGGALFGAFKGAAINAGRAKLQVIQSGNLGANAGAMGIRNPFLIIRRPMTKDAYAYNMQYGYPAFKWVALGQVSGFTRVKSVHLNDVKCTDEEKDMIEAALKEGVIL